MSVAITAQWLTAHQLLLHLSWLELTSCFWISADACPQFCLLLLPLHPHCSAGCAQHGSQTGPFKTCQTMSLLCSKPCYGSPFLPEEGPQCSLSYRPITSYRPPVTSLSWSSLSLTHSVPALLAPLLLPEYARPQGLCSISLEALLLDTCLVNSLTSYRSWLRSHLINEISLHHVIYYCIPPLPTFCIFSPCTWLYIFIFL